MGFDVASPKRLDPISFICIAFAVALTLGYTVANAIVRPVIWSDSGWGLLGWDGRDHLPFNHAASPDFDDISKDVVSFMTIWSPGQHVLPGVLEEWGISLGLAVIGVVAAFSALGIWGWFALYRAFGFPLRTSAVAVAVIVGSRHFTAEFGIYIGGEVLLFGVAPWFLLLVWRLRALTWTAVPLLLAGIVAMVFAKLSGIMVASAAIGASALCGAEPWLSRPVVRRGLVAGTTIAIVGILFYHGWYSRGWTAVSTGSNFRWSGLVDQTLFTVGSTWSASLSLVDLSNYLLLRPSGGVLGSTMQIAYVFLPFAIATFFFAWWRLRKDYPEYLRFTLLMCIAYGAALVLVRAEYPPEDRFCRIVSLLLLGGFVHAFMNAPSRSLRVVAAGVAVVAVSYGLSSHALHVWRHLDLPLGIRDFRHSTANQAVVDFIRKIDKPVSEGKSTLIYVPSPEIGLEVRHARVLASHADFWSPETLRDQKYRGRVSRLYVIVQRRLVAQGKADLILRSFVDYPRSGWQEIQLGEFVCYFSVD